MGKRDLVTVDGRQYITRGWMNGISAPIGTVLGPNAIGEHMTVVETEPHRVRLAHSRPDDFTRIEPDSRSIYEHHFILNIRRKRT